MGVWVKIVYFFRSQDIFSLDLGYIGVMGGVKGRSILLTLVVSLKIVHILLSIVDIVKADMKLFLKHRAL